MTTIALLKLIVISLSVLGFLARLYPKLGVSQLLIGKIGPTPLPGELRSDYLKRVAAFSAVWLVFLLGIGCLCYVLATDFGVQFQSKAANLTAFLMLSIFVGMALLGMIGGYVWSAFLTLFGKDSVYVQDDAEPQDVA